MIMGNNKMFWKRKTFPSHNKKVKLLIPAIDQRFYETRILSLNRKLLDMRVSNENLVRQTQSLAEKNRLLAEER